MNNSVIFCTAAENNQELYLKRVLRWYSYMRALFPGTDLYCFVDGKLAEVPERSGLTFVQLEPKLGRTSTNKFEGYKRSFGKAMEMFVDCENVMLIENDVCILDPTKLMHYFREQGLYAATDEKYGFLETAVMVLNDKTARQELKEHYTSEAGIAEDELFEAVLGRYAFIKPFKSRRVEGNTNFDLAKYDYLAQVGDSEYKELLEKRRQIRQEHQAPKKKPTRIYIKDYHCPGDTLEDTAAIRDLHESHPEIHINVDTTAPELWNNNPHLDRRVQPDTADLVFNIEQPLINQSNQNGLHVIDCIREFLQDKLEVRITPGPRRVDVHLTQQEKNKMWLKTKMPTLDLEKPYWIITPCGKPDFTTKIWAFERYQEVVDRTKDKIQWVQVGAAEHKHKPLNNVIDLRGQTSHRELLRVMYHASGVLCGITYLMHLASMQGPDPNRLRHCIVLNGGRESATFTQYPGQVHLGAVYGLPCCSLGGCWKGKVETDCASKVTMHDGQVVPECMARITADDVIRQMELLGDL